VGVLYTQTEKTSLYQHRRYDRFNYNCFVCLFDFWFCFLPLLLCWMGAHCNIYKGSYNVLNISYVSSPFPTLLYPPTPIPGIASTGIIFAFTLCAHIFHPPTSFPHHLLLCLWKCFILGILKWREILDQLIE
jgi:hypothetical protein